MQAFPFLSNSQVALIRVEKKIGNIVNEDFDFALNSSQHVFTVFDSFEKAKNYSDAVTAFNEKVVIIIYSRKQEILHISNLRIEFKITAMLSSLEV